ncbi:MAG TPA: hypothetical protein VNA25_27125, partial [Phycisphaerae bacterium]|nr:hypothetical protein [Phycisphaerae bacterium]
DVLNILEAGTRTTFRGVQDALQSGYHPKTTDKAGVWIPPRLRWIMAELPDITREAQGHVQGLRRAIKRGIAKMSEANDAGQLTELELGMDVSKVFNQAKLDALNNISSALSYMSPESVCPTCKGDDSAPCKDCQSAGWVSRSRRIVIRKARDAEQESEA